MAATWKVRSSEAPRVVRPRAPTVVDARVRISRGDLAVCLGGGGDDFLSLACARQNCVRSAI